MNLRGVLHLESAIGLTAALLLAQPTSPAEIEVSGGCTLVDAINAANNDDDSGGRCPPGGSGDDTLVLTGDVTLTAVDHTAPILGGETGLPLVNTTISIQGGGFTVQRDTGAPDFRIFDVDNGGALTVENVTVTGGDAPSGSGLLNLRGGSTTLVNATVSRNVGTAVELWDVFLYGGSLRIYRSTIADNLGTGIRNYYGTLTMENSTVSGNQGDGLSNGIYSYASVHSSTLSGNGGDGVYAEWDTILTGSIVANSGDSDCREVSGPLLGSSSFDSDGSCPDFDDLTGLDPVLADNGGPTETHALLAGSSAIDAAGACGLHIDQRGFARDELCDSGSYEFGAFPGLSLEISGSCPGEIAVAIAGALPGTGVRVLGSGAVGNYALPTGPCAGTELSLDEPRWVLATQVDAGGEAQVGRTVSAAWCGRWLQAVGRADCSTSGVAQVPE